MKMERDRFEDAGLEHRSEVATSQGMLAATRSWKRQRKNSLLEPLEGVQPCQHIDLSPGVIDFGLLASRTVRE